MQSSILPRRFSMPEDPSTRGYEYPQSNISDLSRITPLIGEEYHEHDRRNDDDGIVIPFIGEPFNGIIAYLTRSCHDNPAKQGLIRITGNSFNQSYVRVMPHLVEEGWKGWWTSLNEAGSYVSVDFLDHKINLNAYSLKSYNASSEWRHLRAWVIEGSNGSGWKEIHRVKRGGQLNGYNKIATFKCPNNNFFQTIRIKMIAPNYYGDWYFFLSSLEFFGILD
ncbi:F5/8 type C domain containing protein [Tritrichomonas foetus]|uniref:F5/8 type C domain containing protein n=1 Tax=Tritrichomonas foetus TaxID=1144522 RepID=A0A1J4KZ79_9EUKA|nr:F5/8 type C domain containing protein [Tritrichomonas foetus]|eukprot:OHT16168.1 F5/8 type C domain containing protein [Tritrichomonas foetus]